MGQGQDQDPYGDAGGFTPYQPDTTPDSEPPPPPAEPAPAPFVPYGGEPVVPYGGTTPQQFYGTTTTTSVSGRVLPWLIGLGVLVATCGGGIAALIGAIGSIDFDSDDVSTSGEVYVNDLKAGQCLNGAGFATDEPVSGLEIVDCSSAHDVQVLEVNLLDSAEAAGYDFDDPGSSAGVCNPVLSETQKALVQSRDYGLVAFTETGSPGVGDKVACLVKRADDEKIREFLPVPAPEEPA